jgi:hypothetical protein
MDLEGIRTLFEEIMTAVGPEPPVSIEVDVDGDAVTIGDFEANMDWQQRLHDEFKKKDWSWMMKDGE